MDKESGNLVKCCLFCWQVCSEATLTLKDEIVVPGAVGCVQLQRQLQQVFILRQLLEIPEEWCVLKLEGFGGDERNSNPESWFRNCERCIGTVEKAWSIYQQLLDLQSQFDLIKSQIKEVMLENFQEEQHTNCGELEKEIRALVFPDWMQNNLLDGEDNDIREEPEQDEDCEMEGLNDYFSEPEVDKEDFTPASNKRKCESPDWMRNDDEIDIKSESEGDDSEMEFLSRFQPSEESDEEELSFSRSGANRKQKSQNTKKPKLKRGRPRKGTGTTQDNSGEKANKNYCDEKKTIEESDADEVSHKNQDVLKGEFGQDLQLSCQVCSKHYTSRSGLSKHQSTVHPDWYKATESEAVSCDQCDLKFHSRIKLEFHVRNTHNRNNKFVCDTCGKGFLDQKELKIHMWSHPERRGKGEFVCHICGVNYPFRGSLDNHYKKTHPEMESSGDPSNARGDEEVFRCTYCELTSPFKVIIRRHIMETHVEELGFKCDICSKSYISTHSLEAHKRIKHKNGQKVKCPYCRKSFSNKVYMKRHVIQFCKVKSLTESQNTQDQVFLQLEVSFSLKQCQLCKAKFKGQEYYDAHLEKHKRCEESGGEFYCGLCKFPAESDIELEQHMSKKHSKQTTTSKKSHSCRMCSLVFSSWKELKSHVGQKHPDFSPEDIQLQVTCQVCSKKYTNPGYLQHHQKMVHPELFEEMGGEVLSCDQCDLKFSSKIHLEYHVNNVHKKVYNFCCGTCGKGFDSLNTFKLHQRTHLEGSSKREFVCHICGCNYTRKRVLELHYKEQHGEKGSSSGAAKEGEEFKCKHCDLTSPFKVVIMRHMDTHKKEMGYQCDLCSKCYTSAQSLKRHKRDNHGGQQVKCPYCCKSFSNVDYMKSHVNKFCKLKGLAQNGGSDNSEQMKVSKDQNIIHEES